MAQDAPEAPKPEPVREALVGSGGYEKRANVFPVPAVTPVTIEAIVSEPGPLMSTPTESVVGDPKPAGAVTPAPRKAEG